MIFDNAGVCVCVFFWRGVGGGGGGPQCLNIGLPLRTAHDIVLLIMSLIIIIICNKVTDEYYNSPINIKLFEFFLIWMLM